MLVPASAQLPMAHDDARAHNPPSAMAPGTLMFAFTGLASLEMLFSAWAAR